VHVLIKKTPDSLAISMRGQENLSVGLTLKEKAEKKPAKKSNFRQLWLCKK
jgi:hypothetical protein